VSETCFFTLLSTEAATINIEDPVSDYYTKYNFLFGWVFCCCWVACVATGFFLHLASVWNL